jgi:molecular chaperone Hsp33
VALRQEPSARFSQGQIPIGTGAVDHDVQNYLEHSEGVASGVRVLASADAFGRPGGVSGVLVQTLPGGDPARTALPEEISDRRWPADSPLEDLMAAALPGIPVDVLEAVPVRFWCGCSRSRVEMSIRLLGASDLEAMIQAEEATSVRCEFCATDYHVGVEDLRRILGGLKLHPIGEA